MSRISKPVLVDSHVHLDDERLAADISKVLDAAREHNIGAQIVPAVSRQYWPRLKALCDSHPDLYPCYGLHPCFFADYHDDHLQELALWLGREPAVAVGECGLDYAFSGADKGQQQHLFSAQLSLAREFNLPIVIHAVRAIEDVIRMIRASGHYKGVVHSFNGSEQQANRLIDLGYLLSFGGAISYPRAKRLRALVGTLPLDALMLETDAPDQPAQAQHGQRNEPRYLIDVWKTVSELRTEDAETIANATTQNACTLFNLPELSTSEQRKSNA